MFPFVQARHFYRGRRATPRLIVVHDMEAPYKTTTAESVARWFGGSTAPAASAHFCVDADSIVQCVGVGDTAWAAPGANHDGLHIEHAGYARDDARKWLSEDAMLNLSACVAAELVKCLAVYKVNVPMRRLSVREVGDGHTPGFCGHNDVTAAFHRSTHTDPGPGFPWDLWLSKVRWWLPQIRAFDFK